ncbi:hypothetical protein B0J13DRAFT_127884 [Dactylonectria estremocensis]|uniref:Glucose-methanol-choline oxidoreductase N-terminal domain-containing protein n=1 Tax=Dactylonectria estremocensis TaxID=1079267 RepID=A0A9P9FFA1_9HYPO|nr:hypothetical protein B0J13DRAFT_127884 [Dactylonectria estremocensis]
MANQNIQYDFIVVGAGPAGSCIARGLALSEARPAVLLLEAGSDNSDPNLRVIGNEFVQFLNPDQTYPYESTPQEHLANRRIGLARGKGLGGSSAVNFTAWTIGPRDDWKTMAELTNDSAWDWGNALRRWRKLETYHDKTPEVPAGVKRYLDPKPEAHGYEGPLHIGFQPKWDTYTTLSMDAWDANGYAINPDMGSGDFLGISVVPQTMNRGTRTTAADLLAAAPLNLVIKTNSPVRRVEFEGTTAVGVSLIDGTVFKARKEVILSAGSLDTPKILMHSGIGPSDQLTAVGISPLVANPNVGQNFKDHYHIALKYGRSEQSDAISGFFRDSARQAAAMREWQLFRTGDYVTNGTSMTMGFFKSDAVLESKEFAELPAEERERLSQPTIPTYEMAALGITPDYYVAPETSPPILSILVFVHNSQGLGTVKLASADPTVPLDFAPSFINHPYDRRVIVESTREVLKVTSSDVFTKDAHPTQSQFDVPASDSDDDILDFWRRTCTSTWHMSGTCKLGRDASDSVVDSRFRVFGVNGLRVADMSIMPIIPSCHVQSTAYQIGMIAAEKLQAEYSLNGQHRL